MRQASGKERKQMECDELTEPVEQPDFDDDEPEDDEDD